MYTTSRIYTRRLALGELVKAAIDTRCGSKPKLSITVSTAAAGWEKIDKNAATLFPSPSRR